VEKKAIGKPLMSDSDPLAEIEAAARLWAFSGEGAKISNLIAAKVMR
jgi:hypothetical protein